MQLHRSLHCVATLVTVPYVHAAVASLLDDQALADYSALLAGTGVLLSVKAAYE